MLIGNEQQGVSTIDDDAGLQVPHD